MPSRAARSSLRAEGRIVEKLTTIEDELPKVQRQIHKVRIEKNATRYVHEIGELNTTFYSVQSPTVTASGELTSRQLQK